VRSVAPSLAFRHYVNLRRTAGRLDALIAMLKRAAAGTFVTAREFTESLAGRA
jgi:predicted transcriptional regulator